MRPSPSTLPFLPGSIQLSDIRTLYPRFESIFEKHVKDAKFRSIPSKGTDFKTLKLSLISLWHLQNKHKLTHPETLSALIQALVVEHDFQRAYKLILKQSSFWDRCVSLIRPDSGGVESFKHETKECAGKVSDSEFLQKLEGINDEDLRSAAQMAKALAQTELLSSIDIVVKKLTHAVLAMQREVRGKDAQLQVEKEEKEVLNNGLVEFIREINKKSDGWQNSYAYLFFEGLMLILRSTVFLDRVEVGTGRHASGMCVVDCEVIAITTCVLLN